MWIPSRDASNVTVPWGWHRYTRWTGRLSHQTSNLSHPCNLLSEGCDPCLHSIPGSRGVGSDLPSYHQTTKVTLTEGSPERSGYMHMDDQVTHSILNMLFSTRGTETVRVEGLWLVMSFHDITIICSDLPVGKPLHMCIRIANVHLCICQHPCQNPQILRMHPNLFISSLTWILHLWHIYIYLYYIKFFLVNYIQLAHKYILYHTQLSLVFRFP